MKALDDMACPYSQQPAILLTMLLRKVRTFMIICSHVEMFGEWKTKNLDEREL